MQIPLDDIWSDGACGRIKLTYPKQSMRENCDWEFDEKRAVLAVKFRQPVMARMFEIEKNSDK